MREELLSDAAPLAGSANISVANKRHVLDILNPHNRGEFAGSLIAPEDHPVIDFVLQVFLRHVWIGPAIFRNNASVSPGAIVNDGPNQLEIVLVAAANHNACRILRTGPVPGAGCENLIFLNERLSVIIDRAPQPAQLSNTI